MAEQPSTRPLLDKLGVKPGQRIALIGSFADDFAEQLRARGASVSRRRVKEADQIFFGAEKAADLARIEALKPDLRTDGSLWVVRPKGTNALPEGEARRAGLDAGLVDVKVVAFSETHSAMKFVYRLKDR